MAKTNIEKLMGLREKAYELSKTNPPKIALEFKQNYYGDLERLKASEDYRDAMTQGRFKQEGKLRDRYSKQLFELLAEQKAEYSKVYREATKLAKTVQTTSHAVPSDTLAVKLFEQELQSILTSSMLGLNAGRSIEAIDAFVGKYDDPYFASIIKENFAHLSQNVLSIESNLQNRGALARVLERVEMKATSEEQAYAAETLAAFGDGNPTFYLPMQDVGAHYAISRIIGKHADFLDKPSEWLEAQASVQVDA